jgi:2-hydroxy-3-keto-5-methylthiopentenyl-1-phosphate phosphatase
VLQEVAFVRDKNDKIFSAMREEFEQMVQDLDEKPQLTPTERELLERIKEVIEVSEEIVDTGMDNLKKTIRG